MFPRQRPRTCPAGLSQAASRDVLDHHLNHYPDALVPSPLPINNDDGHTDTVDGGRRRDSPLRGSANGGSCRGGRDVGTGGGAGVGQSVEPGRGTQGHERRFAPGGGRNALVCLFEACFCAEEHMGRR